MNKEEILKDISARNSIITALMLNSLFSSIEKFEDFTHDINLNTDSKVMQKFAWNMEFDKYVKQFNKIEFSGIVQDKCSLSDNIEIAGLQKEANKVIGYKVRIYNDTEFKSIHIDRIDKHLYEIKNTDSIIKAHVNDIVDIPRFTLLKSICMEEYFGLFRNAKLKVQNIWFPHGIKTPYDILNRCVLICDK